MGIAAQHDFVSDRARQISASASMALDARAKALKAAGQPIITFGVDRPT